MPEQKLPFVVPVDEQGRPMQVVGFAMSEKIGLPNYSNVDVGPASCYRFVPYEDSDEGQKATKDEIDKCAEVVEEIMREHRERILKIVKGQ